MSHTFCYYGLSWRQLNGYLVIQWLALAIPWVSQCLIISSRVWYQVIGPVGWTAWLASVPKPKTWNRVHAENRHLLSLRYREYAWGLREEMASNYFFIYLFIGLFTVHENCSWKIQNKNKNVVTIKLIQISEEEQKTMPTWHTHCWQRVHFLASSGSLRPKRLCTYHWKLRQLKYAFNFI